MRDQPTKVDVRQTHKARVVRLPPQLTARTEEALAPAIQEALESPTGFVIVDFSGVRTTDSAGVGLLFGLLQSARTRGVAVALTAARGQPRVILERVRLTRYVPLYDSVEEALSAGPPRIEGAGS